MIYFKDKIRYWINKILKVDKDFLVRINVLKNEVNIQRKHDIYQINHNRQKLYLRNLTSDFNVYHQIFVEQEYSFAVELFKTFFGRDPLNMVDVGANIGLTSIYFASLYPRIKILSIEAESGNFAQLKSNTQAYPNIQTVHKAVWNISGQVKINNNFRDGKSWSFQVNNSDGFQSVEAITLREVMNQYHFQTIDILKIDIEGAEEQVILHDKTINKVLDNTSLVCVEIHDSHALRIRITEKISGLGFRIFSKGETLFAVR